MPTAHFQPPDLFFELGRRFDSAVQSTTSAMLIIW